MPRHHRFFDRRRLLLLVGLLVSVGFFATTLGSYEVSRRAVLDAIVQQELPLTSSNIYSELQKDLVRPVLISSTMANDTFLRDWVLAGEKDAPAMARYLQEVKKRYGAFSSFFVSERTGIYYTGDGVLKRVSPQEPRDAWYFRVRGMREDHEINVDPDLANRDALTIFINFRVFDYSGRYIGATGIGLTVDAVRHLIADYQARFQRTIYFVDGHGNIVLFGNNSGLAAGDIRAVPGLADIADKILKSTRGSYEYQGGDGLRLLNVNYFPELKWFLFVEKPEYAALVEIRHTLYFNLAVCGIVTLIVLLLTHVALARYQERIEEMATTDKLTGLLNRQAFDILMGRLLAEHRRDPRPFSILLADLDHFKAINDRYGHHGGDGVLAGLARLLRGRLRASDIAVRWGGEEFLIVLPGCSLGEALAIAEKLRQEAAAAEFDAGSVRLGVTMSIGVAEYHPGETLDQGIGRADAALYQAKAAGRNRTCEAPPPQPQAA
ncbi:MAG TPA: diguanylate cyclase [Rhodocyclaceae bacterium]